MTNETKSSGAPRRAPASGQDERLAKARLEVMNEVAKFFPLDEPQYNELQNAVEQQLARVIHANGNLQRTTENIKKGLPMVRNELDKAAHQEQRKAMAEETRNATRTRNREQER